MDYKQTTYISTKDLKKLMHNKAIKDYKQLAEVSGVEYTYLTKCVNGKLSMSEESWKKVKYCL